MRYEKVGGLYVSQADYLGRTDALAAAGVVPTCPQHGPMTATDDHGTFACFDCPSNIPVDPVLKALLDEPAPPEMVKILKEMMADQPGTPSAESKD